MLTLIISNRKEELIISSSEFKMISNYLIKLIKIIKIGLSRPFQTKDLLDCDIIFPATKILPYGGIKIAG